MSRIIPHSKPFVAKDDIKSVTVQVESGMHATGKTTEVFENKLKEYIGAKFAKATTSGTTALHLSLKALDIGKNDEVIIPSYVCQTLLHSVNYCDAKAVLADIDTNFIELGYNISARTIKPLITNRTKAIIVPHLFGVPAELGEILNFGIPVIEDCCQSIGALYQGKKVGSIGTISMFSFYAIKVISTGQGGMLITSSDEINERFNDLAQYDQREEYEIAYNYGLTDIQSALGIKQLDKLDKFIYRRKQIAEKYDRAFKNCNFSISKRKEGSFPFRYVIKFKTKRERERVQERVREKGVRAEQPVFRPLHSYLGLDYKKFRNTEEAHDTILSIPLYPALSDEDVNYIIESVIEIMKERK